MSGYEARAGWGTCAGCGRVRRLAREDSGVVLAGHNRWRLARRMMVACAGSGHPPAPGEDAVRMAGTPVRLAGCARSRGLCLLRLLFPAWKARNAIDHKDGWRNAGHVWARILFVGLFRKGMVTRMTPAGPYGPGTLLAREAGETRIRAVRACQGGGLPGTPGGCNYQFSCRRNYRTLEPSTGTSQGQRGLS
jgi:hypothetical protein